MADNEIQKVAEMVKDVRTAMMTTVAPDGALLARPMSTQDVAFDGDLWFITQRDTDQVRAILADPRVNVSYAGKGSWVSISGRATVVDDRQRLREYWSSFTDLFLDGGPDDPNVILLLVTAESAEYWGGEPGGRAGQLVRIVKSAVTGQPVRSPNETVDLS